MKKIVLKIVDSVAKRHGSELIEVFSVFLAHIVSNNTEFETVASNLFDLNSLDANEKTILNDFFESLKNGEELIHTKEETIKNLSYFFNERSADELALFFAPFISKDALISQNPDKIRADLAKYPEEIKEAIIKSLEMLSVVKKVYDEEILKEVVNTMIILNVVMKFFGGDNDFG